MNLTEAREHYGVREWGHRAPLAARLLRRVVEVDGCWTWQGATTKGYGRIKIKQGAPIGLTHRAAYEVMVGPIPEGLQLDHLCRNRACCNPDHLEPVTCRENTLRGTSPAAIHAVKTHCLKGHEYDVANTRRRPDGSRFCRACDRLKAKAYRARLKAAA